MIEGPVITRMTGFLQRMNMGCEVDLLMSYHPQHPFEVSIVINGGGETQLHVLCSRETMWRSCIECADPIPGADAWWYLVMEKATAHYTFLYPVPGAGKMRMVLSLEASLVVKFLGDSIMRVPVGCEESFSVNQIDNFLSTL